MNPDYLILSVIAVGVFTAYMAVVHMLQPDRRQDRLRRQLDLPHEEEESAPAFAVFCRAALALFGIRPEVSRETAAELLQAGIVTPHAPAYFLFAQRLLQPLFLLASLALLVRLATLPGHPALLVILYLILAGLLLAAGMAGARLYVANARQRRQAVLMRSFPEAMDLLLVCIESGLGLDAALARVCGELKPVHPAIAQELERTRLELTLLPDRTQALENLGLRTGILPFRSLVSALIQTEKFGTSLVDTLRVLSDDLRTTRLLNAEQRAARLPVFITIPLILCILPSFIIIILGPPIVKVIHQGGIFGSATPK